MRTLLNLVFCGLIASALHAAGLSSTVCLADATLQSCEDQFPSFPVACANGILNYSNFYFDSYASSNGAPLNASQIDLSPLGTVGQTGVTGFAITGLNGSPIRSSPAKTKLTSLTGFSLSIRARPPLVHLSGWTRRREI